MTARTPLFVLLVFLMAPWSAAAPPVATLESARVEASGAESSGLLAALEQIGGSGRLLLSAARIDATLEQESSHTFLNQSQPPLAEGYRDEGPQQVTYDGVQGGEAVLRLSHEVYALPLPGEPLPQARPEAACAAVGPSGRSEVRQSLDGKMHASGPIGRHQERADTRRALEWDPSRCPATTWVVEGSFLLILWEGDLSFQHANGTASYTTGAAYPRDDEVEGDRINRLLYLAVHDGLLRLHAAGAAVFLEEVDIQAHTLVLREATGTIAATGQRILEGQDVTLEGQLAARATKSGAGVAVQVTGTLEAVGGQSVVVASNASPGPRLWVAALLVLPVLAGGGAAAWRRRPARALARLGEMALAGRHEAVASGARRLQRLDDLSGEATALRMEALVRSGRAGAALDQARRLPPMEAALAQAYVYAVAGDVRSCVASLRACAALDPGWLQAALQDPVFAAARGHPSLRAWAGKRGGQA